MAGLKVRGETDIWFAPARISVKDFGPIVQADIELRPLTVLMGPNDTGKTYMAMLLLTARTIVDQVRGWYRVIPKSRPRHSVQIRGYIYRPVFLSSVYLWSLAVLGVIKK